MTTKDQILKASEELQERIDGKRTEAVDEPSLMQLLNKSLDYIFNRKSEDATDEEPVAKSEAQVKEEVEHEENVRKSEQVGEERFFDNLTEKVDNIQESIDASPVLEGFTDSIAKAMGAYEAIKMQQAATDERLAVITDAMGTLLKSHEAIFDLMKSVRDQPVSKTNPGFVFSRAAEETTSTKGPAPDNLRELMFKSMSEGHLDPKYVQLLDTRSVDEVYALLPEGALD